MALCHLSDSRWTRHVTHVVQRVRRREHVLLQEALDADLGALPLPVRRRRQDLVDDARAVLGREVPVLVVAAQKPARAEQTTHAREAMMRLAFRSGQFTWRCNAH